MLVDAISMERLVLSTMETANRYSILCKLCSAMLKKKLAGGDDSDAGIPGWLLNKCVEDDKSIV